MSMVNQVTDRLHVSTSDFGVVRAAYRAFNRETQKNLTLRSIRFEFYRKCIKRHRDSKDTYIRVMTGRL